MVCEICRTDKGNFEITDSDNAGRTTVCSDCLVSVVQWSQGIKDWDEGRGELPFVNKDDVSFISPIYDFIEEL
jgi:hypothetical protein